MFYNIIWAGISPLSIIAWWAILPTASQPLTIAAQMFNHFRSVDIIRQFETPGDRKYSWHITIATQRLVFASIILKHRHLQATLLWLYFANFTCNSLLDIDDTHRGNHLKPELYLCLHSESYSLANTKRWTRFVSILAQINLAGCSMFNGLELYT